jgi:hypothetical protein
MATRRPARPIIEQGHVLTDEEKERARRARGNYDHEFGYGSFVVILVMYPFVKAYQVVRSFFR